MIERIPISSPSITNNDKDYLWEALEKPGEGSLFYPEAFERAFSDYLGTPYCSSLPSGTSGIHLALLAHGIGPGDEVIVPDLTWMASAAPITYVGAMPVFADIDSKNFCLSPSSLKECISPRTKAVIPVGLYGNIPNMNEINRIARENHLVTIEDAAQALGCEYHGKKAGTLGDVGIFSFHYSKMITTGEGGMICTARKDIHERIQSLKDHGRVPGGDPYKNIEVGYKYKMSHVQAALGLAQLERIHEIVENKREIFSWYEQELRGTEGIFLNSQPEGTLSSYWLVAVLLDPRSVRKHGQVLEFMDKKNIECRPFFYPLSSLPAYEKLERVQEARNKNESSYDISSRGINLPSGFNLSRDQVHYICNCLKEFINS